MFQAWDMQTCTTKVDGFQVPLQGAKINAATYLHQWVSKNPSFEDLVYMVYWQPIGPTNPAVQTESERRFYGRMKHIVTVHIIYLEEEMGISSLSLLQSFICSRRPQLLSAVSVTGYFLAFGRGLRRHPGGFHLNKKEARGFLSYEYMLDL